MPDPVQVAGVVLRDKSNRYLLVQESRPQVYGLWSLPAGHIDGDETPQQAAVREAFEETGFEVRLTSQEPLVVDTSAEIIKYAFPAEITGGELVFPDDEILDTRWLDLDSIKKLEEDGKIRSPWVLNAIRQMENV